MKSLVHSKRTDLHNTSVLEVIIVIILILVLLIFHQNKEISELKDSQSVITKTEAEKLQQKIDDLRNENNQLRTENRELKAKIKELKDELEVYKDLASAIKNLKQTNENLKQRLKKDGKDIPGHPPCFIVGNQPHYIGFLAKTSAGWNFTLRIQKEYNGDEFNQSDKSKIEEFLLENVTGIREFSESKDMTDKTFNNYAKQIFDWSRQQNCRFYVRYNDNDYIQKSEIYMMGEYFYPNKKP